MYRYFRMHILGCVNSKSGHLLPLLRDSLNLGTSLQRCSRNSSIIFRLYKCKFHPSRMSSCPAGGLGQYLPTAHSAISFWRARATCKDRTNLLYGHSLSLSATREATFTLNLEANLSANFPSPTPSSILRGRGSLRIGRLVQLTLGQMRHCAGGDFCY